MDADKSLIICVICFATAFMQVIHIRRSFLTDLPSGIQNFNLLKDKTDSGSPCKLYMVTMKTMYDSVELSPTLLNGVSAIAFDFWSHMIN